MTDDWEDQPALERASDAVGTRAGHHGGDREMEMTARFWSAYLGVDIEPHETREMMAMLKIARSKTGEPTLEHHADAAGYMELASRSSPYRGEDEPDYVALLREPVECPVCGAGPQDACEEVFEGGPSGMVRPPHDERIEASLEKSDGE